MKKFIKENKVIVFLLICSVIMLSGLSYAWYKLSLSGEREITLSSGSLELTFTEGEDITLVNAEPLSDEDGLATAGYHFSLKNTGNIDSSYTIYLDDVSLDSGITRMSDSYIKYSLEKNGTVNNPILLNSNSSFTNEAGVITRSIGTDTIGVGNTDEYVLHIWIADSADNGVMNTTFKAKLRIEATQKVETICKRATTLHTETCTRTDSTDYCGGAGYTTNGSMGTTTVTYGSLGVSGVLMPGDAFDCDVNGDGVYDSDTERFYYITDNNSTTAIMIYYNNTTKGIADSETTNLIAYDASNVNTNGPITAIANLPTITMWPKVNLVNTVRNIIDSSGSIKKENFSYDGYAARLATFDELKALTSTITTVGILDNQQYNFLLENTNYTVVRAAGYWLENPSHTDTTNAYRVTGDTRNVLLANVADVRYFGVRPVIEVPKLKILY